MGHLDYALDHTNWYGARAERDQAAITAFVPFKSRSTAPSASSASCPCISGSTRIWW